MNSLADALQQQLADTIQTLTVVNDEVTIEVAVEDIQAACFQLRDVLQFNQLIDICGVDYKHYGLVEWATESTTTTGFSRGVESTKTDITWDKPRFAVVYHLLSTTMNRRLRVRTFCDEQAPMVTSVIDVWRAADWFEREAYDLYGILFKGHPDLRRILTDYGFIGHPFRKDFPVSGQVEMRYDATEERVIYEPVEIEPRVLVPKVIREDNRYQQPEEQGN